MKVGDLVEVIERLGCHVPPVNFKAYGMGIVLQVVDSRTIMFPKLGTVDLGREVVVHLADSGKIQTFSELDVGVVNEGR